MCMNVLPAYKYWHHMGAIWESEEGIGGPEVGVTDGCEPECGYWASLQEQ